MFSHTRLGTKGTPKGKQSGSPMTVTLLGISQSHPQNQHSAPQPNGSFFINVNHSMIPPTTTTPLQTLQRALVSHKTTGKLYWPYPTWTLPTPQASSPPAFPFIHSMPG